MATGGPANTNNEDILTQIQTKLNLNIWKIDDEQQVVYNTANKKYALAVRGDKVVATKLPSQTEDTNFQTVRAYNIARSICDRSATETEATVHHSSSSSTSEGVPRTSDERGFTELAREGVPQRAITTTRFTLPHGIQLSDNDKRFIDFINDGAKINRHSYNEIINGQIDLETTHDYIQTLFPGTQTGRAVAPLLTDSLKQLLTHTDNRDALASYVRNTVVNTMLPFWGIKEVSAVGEFAVSDNHKASVWQKPDHNQLRITRLLKFLCAVGYSNYAQNLCNFLQQERARKGIARNTTWDDRIQQATPQVQQPVIAARTAQFQAPGAAAAIDRVASTTPRAYFIIGGSGSGKNGLASKYYKPFTGGKKLILLDPDEEKKHIPRYNQLVAEGVGNAAEQVHKESLSMRNAKLEKAKKDKKGFVMPSTGSDKNWLLGHIRDCKQRGYYVKVFFVNVDEETCVKRTRKREGFSGRHVNEAFVRSSNKAARTHIAEYKKAAHTSRTYLNPESTQTHSRCKEQRSERKHNSDRSNLPFG